MFKRIMAVGLAVMLLAAEVPATVFAAEASDEAVVETTVEATEESEDQIAQTEVSEEAAEAPEVTEEVQEGEVPEVTEEVSADETPVTTEEVPESEASVATDEVAGDVADTTQAEATAPIYTVKCEDPVSNKIHYELWIENANGSYYAYVASKEDFSDEMYQSFSYEYLTNDAGKECKVYHFDFTGKPNTEYFIRIEFYNNDTWQYEKPEGVENLKVTTKGFRGTYSMNCPEPTGIAINYELRLDGFADYDDYRANGNTQHYLLISETEDFAEPWTDWVSFYEQTGEDVFYLKDSGKYVGKPNTDYWLKLTAYMNGEYVDIPGMEAVKVTTKDFPGKYSATYAEPEFNIVKSDLVVTGFESWNDWNANSMDCYMLVSETEDFENPMSEYVDFSGKTIDDVYTMTGHAYYAGKPNTDYFVKFAAYSNGEYLDLPGVEAKKVTTKDKLTLDASMEVERVSVRNVRLKVTADGSKVSRDELNNFLRFQWGTDPNFEYPDNNWIGFYEDELGEDGKYIKDDYMIYGLDEDTTYYARLVLQMNDGYEQTTDVIGDVLTFKTAKNVVYSETDIPDKVLRDRLIAEAGALDKASLEYITYLDLERRSGQPAIENLKGIELLPNLTSLDLAYHNITDISPIASLKDLNWVRFTDNKITTIPDLSGLTKLTTLDLAGNFIPASEFTESNTNIPKSVLENNSHWLENMAENQRTTTDVGVNLADTYYRDANGKFALQVEATNTYYVPVYELEVYEGDKLLVEKITGENYSYDRVVDWVISDIVQTAGTHKLTFVIYEEGVEVARVDKTITFSDENFFLAENTYFQDPKDTYMYVNAYLYNVGQNVKTAELMDASGKVVATARDLNSYSTGYDRRYEDIFENNMIRCLAMDVSANWNLYKYLKTGSYSLVFTLEDGAKLSKEGAVVVTNEAMVDGIYTTYDTSESSDYAYLSVSGENLDMSKVEPVVYDKDGNAISTLVEYKQTEDSRAIYKIKKTAGAVWKDGLTIRLKHSADYKIVNEDMKKFTLSRSSYTNIYYAEHIAANDTVRVLCTNVKNGDEYTWKLIEYDFNTSKDVTLASCKAVVQNGMSILDFVDKDGKKYKFDTSKNNYRIQMMKGESTISGTQIENVNFVSGNSSYYPTSLDSYSTIYVNNGARLINGASLDLSVLTEDSKLTATLLDKDLNVLSKDGKVTFNKYTNANKTTFWNLTYSFDKVSVKNDTICYVEVKDGEKSLGKAKIYILDPAKPYVSSYSYYRTTGSAFGLWLNGNWPENMDKNKFQVRLYDGSGAEVAAGTKTPDSITPDKNNDNMSDGYKRNDFFFAYTEAEWAELQEYARLDYKVFYDGKEIPYAYFDEGENYHSIGFEPISQKSNLSTQTPSGASYQKRQTYGIYFNNEEAVTVCIYKPYDTEPLKTIKIPAQKKYSRYYFTEADLKGLSYNKFDTKYDIVLLDAEGKFLDRETSYLLFKPMFKDVVKDWQKPGIEYVCERGIMNGVSAISFNPEGDITRGMLVTILHRMDGAEKMEYKNTFSDVPNNTMYYVQGVMWAAKTGVTTGLPGGKFGPDNAIPRQQLATMLYRYAEYKGYDLSNKATFDDFADAKQVESWAQDAMQWAVGNGIIGGKPSKDGMKLDPNGKATRAECAKMIMSFMEAMKN